MPRSKGGVSFQVDETSDCSSVTVVQSKEYPRRIDVNVGFLKVHDRYSIQFTIPEEIVLQENVVCSSQGLGLEVKQLIFKESGVIVFVEYTPEHKEGVVIEKFVLSAENEESNSITVCMHMEILGKHQGTPSLKSGIKCIEHCADYESEQSDWQGF